MKGLVLNASMELDLVLFPKHSIHLEAPTQATEAYVEPILNTKLCT